MLPHSLLLSFIGIQLFPNVMSASAIEQSETATCTRVSPLLGFPSHPGHHRALSSLCYTLGSHSSSVLYTISVVYIYMYTRQSQHPRSSLCPPFPTWYPCLFVLCVSVSISALQIRSSIPFFQIPHACVNILVNLFSSFWLTSLCMMVSRSSHISTNDPISLPFMVQ